MYIYMHIPMTNHARAHTHTYIDMYIYCHAQTDLHHSCITTLLYVAIHAGHSSLDRNLPNFTLYMVSNRSVMSATYVSLGNITHMY